jgi:hypothetical protein
MRRDAEDAHAAGLRDGGGDVSTMSEGKDRELEAELLRELRMHGGLLQIACIARIDARFGDVLSTSTMP